MLRSYIWLTLCVIVWGSNFVFGKILVQYFSPSMLTMLRFLSIVVFLLILQRILREPITMPDKKDILYLFILGVIGVFVNQWSFFVGLETADSTTAALIIALTPILTGFLAAIFLHEKITYQMVIGSVIAIIGIFYVVTNGKLGAIQVDNGLIWIGLTTVTFSIMIIMTRVLVQRLSPLFITLSVNIIALIVSIPFAFLFDHKVYVSSSISPWLFLIGTAVIVHGLANLLWNQHILHVQASKASILSNLEPFVAMVVGFLLLGKPITKIELVGAMLIVCGVVFSTYEKKKRQQMSRARTIRR